MKVTVTGLKNHFRRHAVKYILGGGLTLGALFGATAPTYSLEKTQPVASHVKGGLLGGVAGLAAGGLVLLFRGDKNERRAAEATQANARPVSSEVPLHPRR